MAHPGGRFRRGKTVYRKALPCGPLKRLQKLFFHTPLVYLFVFGSYAYHDYLWYPVFGRRRVREFLRSSPWGALFARYLQEGALARSTAPAPAADRVTPEAH